MRRLARAGLAATVLLLVAVACGGAGPPVAGGDRQPAQLERYTDAHGWSVEYPSDMHLERSQAQMRIFVREVTIASFQPQRAVRSGTTATSGWLHVDPPLDERGRFPADAIAFRLLHRAGGPVPDLELPESRFPLRLADFRPSSSYPETAPRPLEHLVVANGRSYVALAWIGPDASRRRRETLEDVVSSLTFPPARTGSVVGDGFSVVGRAGEYPVGSVTRVQVQEQPFYLVHAPGGFYAVGWRWETISGGYKSRCDVELDARRLEFVCPSLGARWDRVGRVIGRPAGEHDDDPLNVAVAKVGHDGHVLLHPGVARFADERLARTLWPDWSGKR